MLKIKDLETNKMKYIIENKIKYKRIKTYNYFILKCKIILSLLLEFFLTFL